MKVRNKTGLIQIVQHAVPRQRPGGLLVFANNVDLPGHHCRSLCGLKSRHGRRQPIGLGQAVGVGERQHLAARRAFRDSAPHTNLFAARGNTRTSQEQAAGTHVDECESLSTTHAFESLPWIFLRPSASSNSASDSVSLNTGTITETSGRELTVPSMVSSVDLIEYLAEFKYGRKLSIRCTAPPVRTARRAAAKFHPTCAR